METAAVSELKACLGEYLAKVKAGGEVLVTDRGRPVARLVPVSAADAEMPAHLKELERAGLVRIGEGALPPSFWQRQRPQDPKGRAVGALVSERDEGR